MCDFENAGSIFPWVHIDWWICYFLIDSQYNWKVEYKYNMEDWSSNISHRFLKSWLSETIIRDFRQISIIEKVKSKKEKTFDIIVSTRKPYGIATDLFNAPEKYKSFDMHDSPFKDYLKIFWVKWNKGWAKRVIWYIKKESPNQWLDSIEKYKLFFSYNYSTNATVPPEIIIWKPNEIATETFLKIGVFNHEDPAKNCLSYIKTKFFRALLQFNRIQKNCSQKTFELIPLQDFSKSWTDEELYKKYNLKQEEIDYIETMIKPMD